MFYVDTHWRKCRDDLFYLDHTTVLMCLPSDKKYIITGFIWLFTLIFR